METGIKYDIGKPEYGLLPVHALHETVKVLTAGAQKYSRDNWIKVPGAQRRYFDALQRHMWAWKRGEKYDEDDGLHHIAHAICCAMFIHDLDEVYNGGIPDGQDKQEQTESVAKVCRNSKCGCGTETSRQIPSPVQFNAGEEATQYRFRFVPKSWTYPDAYKLNAIRFDNRTTTNLTTDMNTITYSAYGTTWGDAIPSGWDLFFTNIK